MNINININYLLYVYYTVLQFEQIESKSETLIPILGCESSSSSDLDSIEIFTVNKNTVKCMDTTDFVGFLC